jgi:hypothetical protein
MRVPNAKVQVPNAKLGRPVRGEAPNAHKLRAYQPSTQGPTMSRFDALHGPGPLAGTVADVFGSAPSRCARGCRGGRWASILGGRSARRAEVTGDGSLRPLSKGAGTLANLAKRFRALLATPAHTIRPPIVGRSLRASHQSSSNGPSGRCRRLVVVGGRRHARGCTSRRPAVSMAAIWGCVQHACGAPRAEGEQQQARQLSWRHAAAHGPGQGG